MDHDLPATFTQERAGLRVTHDRHAPFFKLVNRGVNVARHVEQQVFTNHAHEVDTRVAHVIFRVVLAEAGAHVAVDCVQTLCNSTGTVDVRLLGDDDLLVLAPVARFESCTCTAEACARDEDVDIVFYDSFVSHYE